MNPRALVRISVAVGLLGAVAAAGCWSAEEDDGEGADKVQGGGDTSGLLKSTLLLQAGCTATKIGPRHLLVAARCASGNKALAAGKTVAFTSAASGATSAATPAPGPQQDAGSGDAGPPKTDAGAPKTDAGAPKTDAGAPKTDAGAPMTDAGAPMTDAGASKDAVRTVTIAEVTIHPSFVAKCKGDACSFNDLASSDAPDVAVLLLTEDLVTVPSVPVDLDPVGEADPLLVVTRGCATLGAAPSGPFKALGTLAAPPNSVSHTGSAYEAAPPQLVARLGASYVVTAGAGWSAGNPRMCASDVGAPLFRGTAAALAGISSSFTTFPGGQLPVTMHHARVDALSRFKIGDWLASLGAATVHSCSESAGGCVKRAWDGGAPEGDGLTGPGPTDGGLNDGSAADAAASTDPQRDTLPSEDPTAAPGDTGYGTEDADAATPAKKKQPGGCSAAPGATPVAPGALGGLGLALLVAAVRRRRDR